MIEEDVAAHLADLVERWHAAILARDGDVLDSLWHDSYLSTGPDGRLISKAEEMESVADPELRFSSLAVRDLHVRPYGDTAVVHGESVAEGLYAGEDIGGVYRFTTVFRLFGDDWRAVASHGTMQV
jgi:ketosteroid isomerase-like protein